MGKTLKDGWGLPMYFTVQYMVYVVSIVGGDTISRISDKGFGRAELPFD